MWHSIFCMRRAQDLVSQGFFSSSPPYSLHQSFGLVITYLPHRRYPFSQKLWSHCFTSSRASTLGSIPTNLQQWICVLSAVTDAWKKTPDGHNTKSTREEELQWLEDLTACFCTHGFQAGLEINRELSNKLWCSQHFIVRVSYCRQYQHTALPGCLPASSHPKLFHFYLSTARDELESKYNTNGNHPLQRDVQHLEDLKQIFQDVPRAGRWMRFSSRQTFRINTMIMGNSRGRGRISRRAIHHAGVHTLPPAIGSWIWSKGSHCMSVMWQR